MEEFYLQLSGDDLDQRDLETVNETIKETGRKVTSIYPGENRINLHIKIYSPEGSRKKYSLKASLTTPVGNFHSEAHEWDLRLATTHCMKNLETIVVKDHEKHLDKKHRQEKE